MIGASVCAPSTNAGSVTLTLAFGATAAMALRATSLIDASETPGRSAFLEVTTRHCDLLASPFGPMVAKTSRT